MAITDHDTVSGVKEAMTVGEALGLQVVRGVELSARELHNFHLLGYGFQEGNTELALLCKKIQAGREERTHRIVEFLGKKGVDIGSGTGEGAGRRRDNCPTSFRAGHGKTWIRFH